VRFVVRQTDARFVLGLSKDNPDESYTNMDFAIICVPISLTNKVLVIENNNVPWSTTDVYAISDVFSLVINAAGYIEYYKNSTLLYTSIVPIDYPIFVDTSIYNNGAGIDDVEILIGTYIGGGMNFNVAQAFGGVLFIPEQLGLNYLTRRML